MIFWSSASRIALCMARPSGGTGRAGLRFIVRRGFRRVTSASGGGVSQFFAKPDYQNLVSTRNATQRTVPDIAMQMGGCPGGITANPTFCDTQERSFTEVFIGGQRAGLIGTSSSSPQFAGVIAHLIQLSGGGTNANPPPAGQPFAPAGRNCMCASMPFPAGAED